MLFFAGLRLDEAGIYPGKDRLCVQCSCTADAKHIHLLFECQKGAIERQKIINKISSVCPIYNQMSLVQKKVGKSPNVRSLRCADENWVMSHCWVLHYTGKKQPDKYSRNYGNHITTTRKQNRCAVMCL